MLAAKDQYIDEASKTIFRLSADEQIRKRCLDREEYYLDMRAMERTVDEKNAEIADKNVEISGYKKELANKEAELADKDAVIADKDAVIADKDAELQRLRAEVEKLKNYELHAN